jgi:AcrR family transcriptional regulator
MPAKKPGRPRREQLDQAILDATEQLLAHKSFEKLSIEAIATCAGISKATIYRRWPNKTAIVLELLLQRFNALSNTVAEKPVRDQLKQRMNSICHIHKTPLGQAVAGIMSVAHSDAEVARQFSQEFVLERRAEIKTLLELGVTRGEIKADLDFETCIDILFGILIYRLLVMRVEVSEAELERLVSLGFTAKI